MAGTNMSFRALDDLPTVAAVADSVGVKIKVNDIVAADGEVVAHHWMFDNAETGVRMLNWWPSNGRWLDRWGNQGKIGPARAALELAVKRGREDVRTKSPEVDPRWRLFTDGGLVGKNPSSEAGTWAWCLVRPDGVRVESARGIVLPRQFGDDKISSNTTELVAAVFGLEHAGGAGIGKVSWYTDSKTTWRRLSSWGKKLKWSGIPKDFKIRACAATAFMGGRYILAGHPSKDQLIRGTKNSVPVSPHNVFVDDLAKQAGADFREGRYDETLYGNSGKPA